MSQSRREKLAAEFRKFLPVENVVDQPTSLAAYECDGLSAYRETPLLVLLPETIEQVQQVMRICHQQRLPVVSRGAGTSLSGGALPHPEGVVLSLAKMKRILKVDTLSRLAVVEPGVRNLAISEAVKSLGLYYAPDPSSQIACSIGGNVAENAGGVHCLKYGLTLHNILALKLVGVDGEIFEVDQRSLHNDGYDLMPLLVGSEGMLAIVVEVTVKLLPIPRCARVVMGVFDSVEMAGDSVAAIIAEGIIPAGIEMMDNPAIRAAEDFVHAGYPVDAEAILICELDGTEEEVVAQIELVEGVLNAVVAPSKPVSPGMRPSACCSGPGARPLSRPWGAFHPITIASMAPSRVKRCPRCSPVSVNCPRNMACRSPMCSTPATVICIR